jgi:tetratricopeptide (TPR) repeat protein
MDKKHPNNPDIVFNLAYVYAEYGDVIAWDTTAKRAVALAPNKEDPYKLLIGGQLAHYDFSLAEKSADSYLKKFPQKPGPYRVLIEDFYLNQQRWDEARKTFDLAESRKVFDAGNYLSLGEIFNHKAGQFEISKKLKDKESALACRALAERSLKDALLTDPSNLHTQLELAQALVKQQKIREAAPLVEKASIIAPRDMVVQSLVRTVMPGKKDIAAQLKFMLRDYFSPKKTTTSSAAHVQ